MKLNDLIEGLAMHQISGSTSEEIFGIACNSKEVEPSYLFATKGQPITDMTLFLRQYVVGQKRLLPRQFLTLNVR
jgi:hypothetical protein